MSRSFQLAPWELALTWLAVLPGAAAHGQPASLVADLNTGPSFSAAQPGFLVAAGGKLFFSAFEPISSSRGLWVTDGTPSGPELLCLRPDCDPGSVAVLGRTLLFTGLSTSLPTLWRSDGTRAGTFPLTDFPVPRAASFLPLGGALYFQRCFPGPTCTLYRTDGTVAGTTPVDPVGTGYPGGGTVTANQALAGGTIYFLGRSGDSDVLRAYKGGPGGSVVVAKLPGQVPLLVGLAGVGNRLFFMAPSAAGQPLQLWTSDGTAAGTRPIANGPAPFLHPSPFHPADGRVYFAANDGTNGRQIWTSDGTASGTRRVTGVSRPAELESVNDDTPLAVVGRHLVFVVRDATGTRRLWKTDGTPESTSPLSGAELFGHPFDFLYRSGDHVLFAVLDGNNLRLWSTDGTSTGTGVFRGFCSGNCTLRAPLVAGAGGAYLAARDPQHGDALYRTDGTEPGTRRLTQYGVPNFSSEVSFSFLLAEVGSRIFFFPDNFLFLPGNPELWESDGTAARRVHELSGRGPSANPAHLTALGDRLFFTACDGTARELWQTAGSAETTHLVAPLAGVDCSSPADLAALAATSNALFFLSPQDGVLRRTDGTAPGTVELATLPGTVSGAPAVLADRPWFAMEDDHGASPEVTVWTSDGTPAGTVPAFTLPPGVSHLGGLTALGDALYFSAQDPSSQFQLWRSDGTQAGTRKLTSFTHGEGTYELLRVGSSVYFVVRSFSDRDSIWKTDGTLFGTSLAVGVDRVGRIHDLRELAGALYFLSSIDSAMTLYRSDGTTAGTTPLRTFTPARFDETMVAFAGRLFLAVDDGEHGLELWTSDGTATGTTLVRDLFPGPSDSQPSGLTVAGNRLFFSADDGVHGRELWQSDGTIGGAGLRLVQDVAPELPSSSPAIFAATADRLYFVADDGLHGRELWTLPLAGPAGCQPADTHLCLNGNRFQVEIDWQDFQGHTGVGHAVPLTADTGTFWFFDPANVETVVKVLDARALNGAFWVFYGALSSVEYTMTVTDTQTGLTRRYLNPSGNLASVGDTNGFGPLGAFDTKSVTTVVAAPSQPPLVATRIDPAAATGSCAAGPQRLCLNGGRFAVEATWKDFQGHTGTGTAVSLTGDTGYFWFFAATNVEVVLKVLDGRGLNGKFWVFYGALSNVEYTLTVTDTATGAVKTYKNPSGQFASVADTGAF